MNKRTHLNTRLAHNHFQATLKPVKTKVALQWRSPISFTRDMAGHSCPERVRTAKTRKSRNGARGKVRIASGNRKQKWYWDSSMIDDGLGRTGVAGSLVYNKYYLLLTEILHKYWILIKHGWNILNTELNWIELDGIDLSFMANCKSCVTLRCEKLNRSYLVSWDLAISWLIYVLWRLPRAFYQLPLIYGDATLYFGSTDEAFASGRKLLNMDILHFP